MRQELYEAVTAYIIENQEKFYRLAYSYTENQEDALDVVQNAVCRILTYYENIRNEEAIKTWCYRIVVNESMNLLRNRHREQPTDIWDQKNVYTEQGFERDDALYEKINLLPSEIQTVIKLRFYEELSLKEIAAVTKANLNTVKARLYRGLKALKVKYEEEMA